MTAISFESGLTELCKCLIGESSEFQVRHAAIIVDHKHSRVTFLECDEVSLLIRWITKKLEAVLNELFHWREGRKSLSALFCDLTVSRDNT